MSILEIILIIIGILVIVISCVLVDRSEKNQQSQIIGKSIASLEEQLTEEDKKSLMNKINELLQEAAEETIVRTDDTLSKISNEKIMSVNEFSEQILEKIKHNHEEVVFLYNMLNNKEKEIKTVVRDVDTSKKLVQNILEGRIEQEGSKSPQTGSSTAAAGETPKSIPTQIKKSNVIKNSSAAEQEAAPANSSTANNNAQILALYTKGMSVVEISKQLGLGQGEVKLVIDLYKGKK